LQNCGEADENYKQLQKLGQSAINGKFVDRPKTDGTDNDDNQNAEIIRIPSRDSPRS
jgi:hypothetical protein